MNSFTFFHRGLPILFTATPFFSRFMEFVVIKYKGRLTILRAKNIFQREGIMFQVSEKASEMIKEHFMDREKIPSIRIILSQGG